MKHGEVQGRSQLFGAELKVSCHPGFRLAGRRSSLHCGTEGRWQDGGLECRPVVCGQLSPPSHGQVEHQDRRGAQLPGTDVPWGGSAVFSCQEGRQLVGQAAPHCLENGTWSQGSPQCQSESRPVLAVHCLVPRSLVPAAGHPSTWTHDGRGQAVWGHRALRLPARTPPLWGPGAGLRGRRGLVWPGPGLPQGLVRPTGPGPWPKDPGAAGPEL